MPRETPPKIFPRGIYYEADKDRYRVRLYRNNNVFFGGYFATYALAEDAWRALRAKIRQIPKLRRNEKEERTLHAPSLAGILTTIDEDLQRSPHSKRVGKK